jgi:hypothetical protein
MTEIGDLVSLKAFDNPDETRFHSTCLARPITRSAIRRTYVNRAFTYA